MIHTRWNWRRIHARILMGLLAPAGLALSALAPAAEPLAPLAKAPILIQEAVPAGLASYRALALEKQPALAAYRASAAAAEAKSAALDKLHLAALIRRDLPTRRQQAEQGVLAAHAQLRKAEQETLYAVTRTYLSLVYARQQLAIADRALEKQEKDGKDVSPVTSLYYLRGLAERIRRGLLRPDVKEWHVDQIDVLILTTTARRREAQAGVERARAALIEAIGVERDCLPFLDGPAELPDLRPLVERKNIIALALERRGEIVQAMAGLETTSLEIHAQKKSFSLRSDTFASGSDLHADAVPQGIANGEYRPGAITVEMPAQLVGKRGDRIEQAEALQGRAAAVADKARHLVTLEAEDAYLRWIEASQQVDEYQKAANKAKDVADFLSDPEKGFKLEDREGRKPTLDSLVEARVRAVQLQLLANQVKLNALLALAALERITAGGFNPGFEQWGR